MAPTKPLNFKIENVCCHEQVLYCNVYPKLSGLNPSTELQKWSIIECPFTYNGHSITDRLVRLLTDYAV